MRNPDILRVFRTVVLTLFLAGVAVAQNTSPTTQESSSASTGDGQQASAAQTSDASTGPATPTVNSTVRQLGTPFPLALRPEGVKVGPLTVTDVSTSGFYETSAPVGESSQSIFGDMISSNIVYEHVTGQNNIAFQTRPDLSLVGDQVFLNQEAGIDFTRQVTARWTLTATNQFAYFQNSQLQNPQYLVAYGSGGFFLQPLFTQQRGSSLYDTTSFSGTYQMSGRTQVSFLPQVGATFSDQFGDFNFITYFGGGVSVNHDLSATRSVSFSYNFVRSTSSLESAGYASAWNTSIIGGGFRQQIGQSIWITGNLSASYQSGVNAGWTPLGSIGVMKTFRTGNLLVTYSRSQAQQVLLSNGYFDQADLAYTHHLTRNLAIACGAGTFRTVRSDESGSGRRVSASVSYEWLHDLQWFGGYNFSSQSGTQPTLNLGTTTYISFGLRWKLGRRPGL